MTQAFNYTRIQSRCVSALTRGGKPGVLRQPGSETGDEWDPTFGSPVLTDIILLEYRPQKRARPDSLIDHLGKRVLVRPDDGLNIQQEDRVALDVSIAGVDNDTEWFEILDVQKFSPGGTVLFWELELKT